MSMDASRHRNVADHGPLVLLEHLGIGAICVAEVRCHLLARSTSALFELLCGLVGLDLSRSVELFVEHVHHVAQAVQVVGEIGWVDVPEHIASVTFSREEDQACEIYLCYPVRDFDRCDLVLPLLVLARAHVRSIFERRGLDIRNPGVAILRARERRRVGNAVVIVSTKGITFFRFIMVRKFQDCKHQGESPMVRPSASRR